MAGTALPSSPAVAVSLSALSSGCLLPAGDGPRWLPPPPPCISGFLSACPWLYFTLSLCIFVSLTVCLVCKSQTHICLLQKPKCSLCILCINTYTHSHTHMQNNVLLTLCLEVVSSVMFLFSLKQPYITLYQLEMLLNVEALCPVLHY